jgi:hypothetical protein
MRRSLAIAVAVLLAVPMTAGAKGITSAKVCGSDGCRTVESPDGALLGGPPTSGPTRPEPFVRLELRVGVPDRTETVEVLFLPRSELLLADNGEEWMQPLALAQLRALAQRVTPFAASALPAAALAGIADRASSAGPREADAAPASDGGVDAWWLAVAAGAIVLTAGGTVARRRRRGPPAGAADAMGA